MLKRQKTGDADIYLFAVKGWYVLLRETWEQLVEEELLCGVVERFAFGVSTLKLKKLLITPEMLKEVESGMTGSSNWVHDSAMGLNQIYRTRLRQLKILSKSINLTRHLSNETIIYRGLAFGQEAGTIRPHRRTPRILDWLIGTLTAEKIDVLIVARDIFDSGSPSNTALEQYYKF